MPDDSADSPLSTDLSPDTGAPASLAGGVTHLASGDEEAPTPPVARFPVVAIGASAGGLELERELVATKEYLQTTAQELETTNGERQSANEERQSANEELETSKEELQSTNEELATVNDEPFWRALAATAGGLPFAGAEVARPFGRDNVAPCPSRGTGFWRTAGTRPCWSSPCAASGEKSGRTRGDP